MVAEYIHTHTSKCEKGKEQVNAGSYISQSRLDIYGSYLRDVKRPVFKLYLLFICPFGIVWLYQDGGSQQRARLSTENLLSSCPCNMQYLDWSATPSWRSFVVSGFCEFREDGALHFPRKLLWSGICFSKVSVFC